MLESMINLLSSGAVESHTPPGNSDRFDNQFLFGSKGNVAGCDAPLNTLVKSTVIALILWDFWRFYRLDNPHHGNSQ